MCDRSRGQDDLKPATLAGLWSLLGRMWDLCHGCVDPRTATLGACGRRGARATLKLRDTGTRLNGGGVQHSTGRATPCAAGQAHGQPVDRIPPRPLTGGLSELARVLVARRRPCQDRNVETGLQTSEAPFSPVGCRTSAVRLPIQWFRQWPESRGIGCPVLGTTSSMG